MSSHCKAYFLPVTSIEKMAITHFENLIFGANISAILNDPRLVILPV